MTPRKPHLYPLFSGGKQDRVTVRYWDGEKEHAVATVTIRDGEVVVKLGPNVKVET